MRRPIEVPGRTRAFAASNGAGWSRICEFLQTPPAGCSRKGRKAKCQIRAIREAHEGSEKRDAARVPRRFCEFFKVNARMAGLFPPVLEYPGVPSPGAGRRARTRRCRCHPAGSMPPTICPTRISCMVHTPPSGARGHYADGYERNSPAPRRLRSASAGASNEAGWLCQGSASGRLAIEFYTSRILGAETLRPC
ncbi:hypothetical protein PhaeoP72_04092 (plasmid) [Phaeobacter inhibens]|nr:hypothetical protein PhaeoP72_04092 [Phaeobacter inhibens]